MPTPLQCTQADWRELTGPWYGKAQPRGGPGLLADLERSWVEGEPAVEANPGSLNVPGLLVVVDHVVCLRF